MGCGSSHIVSSRTAQEDLQPQTPNGIENHEKNTEALPGNGTISNPPRQEIKEVYEVSSESLPGNGTISDPTRQEIKQVYEVSSEVNKTATFLNDEEKAKRSKHLASLKRMSTLIWNAPKPVIQRLMQEYQSEGMLRRGSVFLSFLADDRHDAVEMKRHLVQRHQYDVIMCDEADGIDRMQEQIR